MEGSLGESWTIMRSDIDNAMHGITRRDLIAAGAGVTAAFLSGCRLLPLREDGYSVLDGFSAIVVTDDALCKPCTVIPSSKPIRKSRPARVAFSSVQNQISN